MHSQDEGVIATNTDASICKRFAVQQGYWQDNYIQHFVKVAERKAPEINRGYYARVKGIETILQQFLDITQNLCQVINLGAGFDTRYWQLKEARCSPQIFYEVDFGAVTSRKCMAIRRRKPLQTYFDEKNLQYGPDEIHTSDYHLIATDIRNISELEQKLTSHGLDKSLPTIFVAECVMVYLHPQEAETVIKWAGENFKNAVFLNYEQVNMNDTFGSVMINNLKRRQCELQGALTCPTLHSQVERFKRLSWSNASALDMSAVYQRLPFQDRERVEKLEMLDEVNLFYQLLNHYCISWAFNDENGKDSVVLQKEKEWKEAFQLRVRALEESVILKEKELKQEKLRFLKLKEDFEYNLKLLIERDEELEKYDAVIGKIRQAEHVKTAEVSELYVKIDELKMNLENEQKAKEELQKHYQKRLQEYQNELKNFRELKDNEVAKEREELSSFRRNLESQLREAEDNFEFCRQELVSNFDQVMKKREQEYRAKLDETSGLLLSNELKVRSLRKELELLRSDSGRCKDELTKTELSTRELEKLVKEKDWMIADLENTHQYKITDLKMQLENMKKTGDKLQEDFQRKHAQLDRVVREREEMLANAKQGFAEEERQLQKKIRELHGQLETKDEEYRQKEWRFVDMKKENDVTVHKLQQTISEMKDKLDKESEEYARCTVAKDIEVEALHEQEAKLRSELAQRKEDLERRQKELAMSLEREASLERSRVQLELDWQRRCEEAERTGYERQEELVRNLTQGKEEALSLVKQQKRELEHKDSVIRILTTQRDESLATLKRHGLPVPPQIPHKDAAQTVENTADLQVQNENLLQIIHQMREDMEDLTKQLSKRTAGSTANTESGVPITEEYVASLEKEIREVKAKNRELTQSLANTQSNIAEPNQVVDKNDPRVRSLVTQLNETIGSLRQEKLDLTSQVRKYEATVMHLQTLLHQSSNEIRQRQVNIDQLEYQLSREHRRSEEEMNALKKQNSDLSLQVTQARYEADEFYKTGLERNIDAVALGNQLSTLKLDLVSQGKIVNSRNPQSRYVQDLQDEIQRLRKQLEDHHSGKKTRMQSSETTLHAKLREAAHRINELTKEREKLIKMGNKLRAELLKYKDTASSTSDNTSSLPAGHVNVPSRSNLRGLEQLQYQLTSRELQYAQQTLTKHTEQIAAQEPSLSNKPAEATGLQVSTKIPDDVISPWQPSFSSDDRSSLQEVWKLLDEDSPGFTSREIHEVRGGHARERSSTPDSLTVKGEPSQVQVKPESTKPALSAKAAGKWKPAPPPKAKIRNYNMRDEDVREGL